MLGSWALKSNGLTVSSDEETHTSTQRKISNSVPVSYEEITSTTPDSPQTHSCITELQGPSTNVNTCAGPRETSHVSSETTLPSASVFTTFYSECQSVRQDSPSLCQATRALSTSKGVSAETKTDVIISVTVTRATEMKRHEDDFPVILACTATRTRTLRQITILSTIGRPLSERVKSVKRTRPLFPTARDELVTDASVPVTRAETVTPHSGRDPNEFAVYIIKCKL